MNNITWEIYEGKYGIGEQAAIDKENYIVLEPIEAKHGTVWTYSIQKYGSAIVGGLTGSQENARELGIYLASNRSLWYE